MVGQVVFKSVAARGDRVLDTFADQLASMGRQSWDANLENGVTDWSQDSARARTNVGGHAMDRLLFGLLEKDLPKI
jgi:hypothetical protein